MQPLETAYFTASANKFYVDQKYMYTVCYAISKSPKQLPSYLKIAEIN